MKIPASFLQMVGLIALVPLSAPAASIFAQWNFDDIGNAGTAVSAVGGYTGTFVNTGGRSVTGGGVSGAAGDYSFVPGGNTGSLSSNTASFLGALNTLSGGQQLSITYWQNVTTQASSTAFWANSPGATGSNRGLSAHSPWSDGNSYYDSSGCCDASNRISGALGATLGTWQLMSFTYSAGTKTIHRDSTQIATGTGALALNTNFDAFIIGNGMNGTEGMNAQIDNFTIWNGALTPAEITALAVRPVPEPASALLGILAGAAIVGRRRRRPVTA
ncbi:MAG: LamG-like jellyroll fold domain-containing protein [Verrucomicrobiota bacterium]